MGRPKAVNIKTFPLYDKFHTEPVKMMCGVSITALYPIKETEQYYISPEVWASCCSKFRRKKPFELSVNLPTITDEKTINFLKEECWHDWVTKELAAKDSDVTEAVAMLDTLFPNKEKIFFYELDSIINSYCWGNFGAYDETGNLKVPDEHNIKNRKYYTHKYNKFIDEPGLKALRDKWTSEANKTLKSQYLTEWRLAEQDYVYEHNCLDSVFFEIGKNTIVYPVVFSENTAEWSKEKLGKLIAYAHAGEIYFVITPDTVFFEIKRHF